MVNSLTIFVKDYIEVLKVNAAFCKNHWKGMIVLTAGMTAVEVAVLYQRFKEIDKEVSEQYDACVKALYDDQMEYINKINELIGVQNKKEPIVIEYEAL